MQSFPCPKCGVLKKGRGGLAMHVKFCTANQQVASTAATATMAQRVMVDPESFVDSLDAPTISSAIERLDKRRAALAALLTVAQAAATTPAPNGP